MFKKYLCLMLCVLLALSTLSTAAFAANYTYSVNNLSASAVTFTVGGNAVIDLPTTESSVTATVNVTNSDASAQGVVFWIGKYVDGVLEDVVYCSDTSVAAAATEELSTTISNVKKETGEKTVGSTTVTYDKVVLKAYVWTNTGKAIAKEANLPNIGAGLHFLKNGAPIATTDIAPKFSEADTDYTVVLKRNPAEFPSFRMVSGDNTTTIVQPEEYNLNGNNVVTVTKKAVNAETGAVEDVTTTYNFNIAYEAPEITWTEPAEVSALPYKYVEYVEGDTFSAGDGLYVNRGGSESGQTAWYATAIGEKLKGLDYIRGRELSKPSSSAAGGETAANIKSKLNEFVNNKTPLLSFTANIGGTIYAVAPHASNDSAAKFAVFTDADKVPAGGVWTSLDGVDGHVNADFTPDHTAMADYNATADTRFALYMKNRYSTLTAANAFRTNLTAWPNNISVSNKPYGFMGFAAESSGYNSKSAFAHAYKKEFNAGDTVNIPAFNDGTYTPIYFIKWNDTTSGGGTPPTASPEPTTPPAPTEPPIPTEPPTPTASPEPSTPPAQSSDATLSKLVYTVGAETAEYTVTDFDVTDEGGTYNVTLPEGTTSVTVAATKNDENASISGVPTAAVTFVKNGTVAERTKQVVITVTAQDSTVKTYTINFVSPIILELTTTADRLAGKAMSNTVAWGDTAKPATHDMLTLVNAPLKANLDLYVARTYGLGQLGSAWLDESVNLLAKVEAIPNVGENSQGKTVAQRYRETDPGDALYSFVAPKGGTVYALTDVNMAATFTDGDGTDAGAIWTVLNNGVVPYGPDNTTKLDANKTIDITTATTKYASNATFKLSATQINNGDGSKGLENFTEAAKQMKYAALIPSSFTPTSQEGTGEEYKYYATMFMSANANLYNNATIGIEAAYANTTGTVDAPEFAYVTQGYDSNPAAIKSVIPMKYCYSLPFDEGDTVEIPCWPNDKSSSTGMIILVKWNN